MTPTLSRILACACATLIACGSSDDTEGPVPRDAGSAGEGGTGSKAGSGANSSGSGGSSGSRAGSGGSAGKSGGGSGGSPGGSAGKGSAGSSGSGGAAGTAVPDGGASDPSSDFPGDTYLPWAGGPEYFAKWKNGPPSDPSFFPIAVWLQSPPNAKRYKDVGINLFVGLWEGPTEDQLSTL